MPVDLEGLPDRRRSVSGTTLDGEAVTVSFSISRKLYRCPACRAYIEVGAEHALVRTAEGHQHWHLPCTRRDILRTLKGPKIVPT